MNIKIKNYDESKFIPRFQEGGEMAAPAEAAPAEAAPADQGQGGDPTEQILAACQEALQSQNCELAMQVCQVILQMAGGGAEQAPAAPEGQQPVYKKGGKLSRWQPKN